MASSNSRSKPRRPAETLKVQGPGIAPLEINRPLDLIEREIEIRDDQDQPIEWSFLRPPPAGTEGADEAPGPTSKPGRAARFLQAQAPRLHDGRGRDRDPVLVRRRPDALIDRHGGTSTMMGVCLLTIGALLVAADEPDPTELVRRLGSDRFAERVEATKALERLGPAALPALRAARDSENPKVRARVAALLETLDRGADVDRLTRPTLIKLDFRDRPLSEIVDTLNARHNLGLTFQFGPLPSRGDDDGLRFARAEGQGGRSPVAPGHARGGSGVAVLGGRQPTLRGRSSPARPAPSGTVRPVDGAVPPLRRPGRYVGIDRLRAHSGSRSSACIRPSSGTSSGRRVRAKDFPDPRLALGATGNWSSGWWSSPNPAWWSARSGRPTFVEAVNDRNRSLLPPEDRNAGPNDPSNANHQLPTLNGSSGFDLSASLRLPDQAGRSIRRLRGSVPVVIVAYASDPIAIPLEGAAGKSVRNDEVTVSVLEVARDDPGGVTVEVEVAPNRPAGHEPNPWNQSGPPDFVTFRSDQLLNRLELLDADGRELALSWNQGHGRDPMTINRRVRLTPTILYEDQPPDAAGNVPAADGEEAGPRRAPLLWLRADVDRRPISTSTTSHCLERSRAAPILGERSATMVGACLVPLMSLVLAIAPDAASLVARLGSGTLAEREESAKAARSHGPGGPARPRGRPALVRRRGPLEAPVGLGAHPEGAHGPAVDGPDRGRRPAAPRGRPFDRPAGRILGRGSRSRVRSIWSTLASPSPIPFWEAVDRLGLRGGHFDIANPGGGHFPTLEFGGSDGDYPVDDLGPVPGHAEGPARSSRPVIDRRALAQDRRDESEDPDPPDGQGA